MLCKIADLLTEVPEAGGLAPRCKDYLWNSNHAPDIVIRPELYEPKYWPGLSEENMVYMESGVQFYSGLLFYNGMMLHASAVEMDGKAYLFSGQCRVGKSTHTRLWQEVFGEKAQIVNDDKPALRRVNGKWLVYGTPWCGKDGINRNRKVSLAGICFLRQASENNIRRLDHGEAVKKVISQTPRFFSNVEKLDMMTKHVDKLVREIPIFELENKPEKAAVMLSYATMRNSAEEMGL